MIEGKGHIMNETGLLLIVDDHEDARDILSRRLGRQGYTTATAEDGARALEYIREHPVDLVLLDIMMPGICGFEVLEILRGAHSMAELPVIMVTAKAQSEDIVHALNAGANDYLTKPIDFPVALARIQTHLRLKHTEETLREAKAGLERQVEERTADLRASNAQALRQSAMVDGINRIFREALTCETEEEVARTCLAVAEELTGSKFGLLGELNPSGLFDTLAISNPGWNACNVPGSLATRIIKNMEIRGVDRSTLKEGKSRIVNDLTGHPDAVGVPEGHPPVTCFLGVPLRHAGKTIGMVGLANKEGGYVLSDQEGVEALAAAFVQSLVRMRMEVTLEESREKLVQQVRQQEALLKISQVVQEMAQPGDMGQVMQVCLDQVRGAGLDIQAMAFHRVLPGRRRIETCRVGPGLAHSAVIQRPKGEDSDLMLCWRTGQIQRGDVGEDQDETESFRSKFGGLPIRSYVNMPFSHGVLSAHSIRPDACSPGDIAFLGQIAQTISVSISRVEDLERLDALVRHLPGGVCLLDGEQRLILANQPAVEILQMPGEGYIGETISYIGGKPLEAMLRPREDGLPHEVEITEPSKRIFEVETQPIRQHARSVGWVLMLRDVTQEREVQQKIQTQHRLASVGQLAAGIAHDFNNMLTVMMGCAQIMEMRPDVPDSRKEDLRMIYTQGERAAQLIRQILDFSRQTVVERRAVDLGPFLKEAVKMMTQGLPETIRIATEIHGERHVVNANLTQLQQVCANLCVNARDAMPHGGDLRVGLSDLRLSPSDRPPVSPMAPGEWVVWTVSDTGCGIPPDVIDRIYEPFFTTKARGEGTGLGMAQVYGIVKQYDGFIDVESEEGKGTVFTIYLPRFGGEEASVEQEAADLPVGHEKTILVVEDTPDVLKVAKGMLEALNYRVVTAANGVEALEVFGRHREEIGLVLTDMVMPDMGGLALFDALRERDDGVPVVLMTGYASEVEEKRLPADIAGVLDKPLIVQEVARVVAEALGVKSEE